MFNFSTALRETQWRMFRRWVLTERRAVPPRLLAIRADLSRLGRVTAIYKKVSRIVPDTQGAVLEIQTVTEERVGFLVTAGSSLERLFQAFVVQGGNPCEVSLFLEPDEVLLEQTEDVSPNEKVTDAGVPSTPADQPYYGVVSTQSTDSYGPGGRYRGGLPTFLRDVYNQAGRYFDTSDAGSRIWNKIDQARRWTNQSLQELARLENMILRLVDLREQLLREEDEILVQAVGGTVGELPAPNPNRFQTVSHLARVVHEMDGVFYEKDPVTGAPLFSKVQKGTGENPAGISLYDGLLDNHPGSDPSSSL